MNNFIALMGRASHHIGNFLIGLYQAFLSTREKRIGGAILAAIIGAFTHKLPLIGWLGGWLGYYAAVIFAYYIIKWFWKNRKKNNRGGTHH